MNCEEVQSKLVVYLDREVTTAEQRSIDRHLAWCPVCQHELAALAATQQSVGQALHNLAARTEPSPQALRHLQARLAEEARPSLFKLSMWFSRSVPGTNHTPNPNNTGDQIMRRRNLVLVLMVMIALTVMAVFAAKSFTPVSAQQILERATAAQPAVNATQGIEHIRVEVYGNYQASQDGQAAIRTIAESYLDLQSGKTRWVVTDADTGKVLNAFAFDGSYTYSTRQPTEATASGPLTLYRVPQSSEKVASQLVSKNYVDPSAKAKQLFEQFRSDPGAQVEKQSGADGRPVYILRSQQPAKIIAKNGVQVPMGTTTMIFDAQTYHLLESRTTVQQDGQEVLVNSDKYLADEVLPAETPVVWDLSDLQGVMILDDPQGKHADLLPETVSPEELAAQGQWPYVLAPIPAGFSQEITAAPDQPKDQPFVYVVSYRNQAGDYFAIQSDLGPDSLLQSEFNNESYQTASGLEVHFGQPMQKPKSNQQITSAIVITPDGTRLMVTSSLPRQQIKALLEDLVQPKG